MSKSLVRIVSLCAVLLIVAWATVGFGQKGLGAAEQNQTSEPAQDVGSVLNLYNPGIQVMTYSADSGIYQHVYNEGIGYFAAWQSAPLALTGSPSAIISIGDINNDGNKEVVASTSYGTRTVKYKGTWTTYYNFQIFVYRNGCAYGSQPDSLLSSGPLGEMENAGIHDSFIADADNDGSNELVLLRSREVDVCRLTLDEVTRKGSWILQKIGDLSQYSWRVEAGDADNDGKNEIVVSSMDGPYPVIFKYNINNGQWDRFTPDSTGLASTGIREAKIRDADNMGDNEIIARGYPEGLVVWKWNGSKYGIAFAGPDVGGGNGIDAADIDRDDRNEVILTGSRTERKKVVYTLLKYSFNGTTFQLVDTYASPVANGNNDFEMGDLDRDGLSEIAVTAGPNGPSGPLKVLHFSGVEFQTVYSTTTSFFSKLEIR